MRPLARSVTTFDSFLMHTGTEGTPAAILPDFCILLSCLAVEPCPYLSPRAVQIDEFGTIAANSLKQIKAGGDGVGLRTYDP